MKPLIPPHPLPKTRTQRGLTLIELLVVIGVLSIMGALGFFAATGVVDSTRSTKLQQDVATINNAIRVYEAAGGSVTSQTEPQDIINQLKTTLTGDAKRQNASATRSNLVDPGLKAVMLNGVASTSGQRAVWAPASRSFVVLDDSGTDGIREFTIDPALAALDYGEDVGRSTSGNFAVTNNWVWDDSPTAVASRRTPNMVGGGDGSTEPTTGTGTLLTPLLPPSFSLQGGERSLASYPLTLTLSNLNTGKPSEIFYAVGTGTFLPYTEGTDISVDAGQTIKAMVYSLKPDRYSDSSIASETYTVQPVQLEGALAFSESSYNYFEMGGSSAAGPSTVSPPIGTLTLLNSMEIPARYQASTYFKSKWTFDGTDPLAASGNIITGPDFNNGFPVAGHNVPVTLNDFQNAVSGVLTIKHALKSEDTSVLTSSVIGNVNLAMDKVVLIAPEVTIVSRDATITTTQSLTELPLGYRIYYTVDGQDPGLLNGEPERGTLYAGTFQVPGNWGDMVTVKARLYAPVAAKDWFEVSPAGEETVRLLGAEDFFVGGSFFHPTGTAKRNIARIQGAGTVDNTFNTGTGTSYDSLVGVVRRASTAGAVYAGGDFTSVNAVNRVAFVRLNANGSVDTSFNANLSNN